MCDTETCSSASRKQHGASCSAIWQDLWRHKVISLIYFLKMSGIQCLVPNLHPLMQDLGITASDTGYIKAITLVTAVCQPLAAFIFEKIGNFKVVLAVLTALNPIPVLLMLLVPSVIEDISINEPTFSYACNFNETNSPPIILTHTFPCSENMTTSLDNSAIQVCGLVCTTSAPALTSLNRLSTTSHEIGGIYFLGESYSKTILVEEISDIRRGIMCIGDSKNALRWCNYQPAVVYNPEETLTSFLSYRDTNQSFPAELDHVHYHHSGNCTPITTLDNINLGTSCERRCEVLLDTSIKCSRPVTKSESNYQLVFLALAGLRTVSSVLQGITWITFEGATLAIMKETDGNYGLHRSALYISAIVMPPLAGFMIDHFNDFRPLYYLYTVCEILSACFILCINLNFKKPAQQLTRAVVKVLFQGKMIGVLFAAFISGAGMGFLDAYLYMYIGSIGGSKFLMGLTVTVSAISALPLAVFCKYIVRKCGHVHVIALGMVFYGIRSLGYSLIYDPWHALFFEVGESITSGLAIPALSLYVAHLATSDTLVFLQTVTGVMYYTVGTSIGSLIGAPLNDYFGYRVSFQLMALGVFVCGIFYSIANIFASCKFSRK